jgi:hypothetical protein
MQNRFGAVKQVVGIADTGRLEKGLAGGRTILNEAWVVCAWQS